MVREKFGHFHSALQQVNAKIDLYALQARIVREF